QHALFVLGALTARPTFERRYLTQDPATEDDFVRDDGLVGDARGDGAALHERFDDAVALDDEDRRGFPTLGEKDSHAQGRHGDQREDRGERQNAALPLLDERTGEITSEERTGAHGV